MGLISVYIKYGLSYEVIESILLGFMLQGLQIQMSTLQIIGHDFCQVLMKLPDRDSKLADIIVPLEDLYVTNNSNDDKRYEMLTRSILIFVCSS